MRITIYLHLIYLLRIVYSEKRDWTSILSHKINKDIQPPLVVFFGSTNVSNSLDLFKQLEAPVINIQSSAQALENDSQVAIFHSLYFKHSRSPNFYVILEIAKPIESLFSTIEQSLQFIIWLFPSSSRPKCLLILLDADDLHVNDIEKILSRAWRLKFLDITLLRVNKAAGVQIHNYNPFTENLRKTQLSAGSELFYDKLKNMHGFTLRFPLIHFPPLAIVKNDSGTLKVGGHYYPYFEIFAETLNFNLDTVPNDWQLNTRNMASDKRSLHKLLENEKVDGRIIPSVSNTMLLDGPWSIGYTFFSFQVVVIVPIIKTNSIEIPSDIGMAALILVAIVILIRFAAKMAKVPSLEYGILDVYQNFLGQTASSNPKDMIGKISLWGIFVLSLVFSGEVLSRLTSIRLFSKELDLDTFEDIESAGLNLVVPYPYQMIAKNHENVAFQKLFNRSENLELSLESCISKLIETKSCVCMMPLLVAEYYIRQQKPSAQMKVSQTFHSDIIAFPYKKASPYVGKLSGIQQRIIEGGLPKFRIPLWGYEDLDNSTFSYDEADENLNDDKLYIPLIIIVLVGFAFSVLMLIIELSYHHLSKK